MNRLGLVLLASTCMVNAQSGVFAPPGHTNFSTWLPAVEFPSAQQENLTRLFAKATEIVRDDLTLDFAYRCIWKSAKYPDVGDVLGGDAFIEPQKVFDNVYFVGERGVSAWAIDTGDGLIIIDSLNNGDEIEKVMVPGLKSFGFRMSDVKALIVTHEHLDHYGGAGHVQRRYGIPIYASEVAWNMLETIDGCPSRENTISDNNEIKVSDYAVTAYHTPGHTPGCMSLMFPVTDNGRPHLVALYGGGGVPSAAEDKSSQMSSFARFADLVAKNEADTLLSNHVTQDGSLVNLEILAHRECGTDTCKNEGCSQRHPYVVGTDYYVRYLQTMSLCVEVAAARENQDLYY